MMTRRHFLTLAAAPALAQDQEPVFRVDVKLVRILATVKNNSGDLVGDLKKEDFQVSDNGVRQEVTVFERYTAQPLSVAVLIDSSASTAIESKYVTDSVQRFLRALLHEGNPEDAVALYSFSWETIELAPFTRSLGRLEGSMKSIKSGGGTSMYDAMFFAARDLDVREGRKVMVIVTDGGDTTSAKNFHQALESVQRADAVIYPILVMPITNDAGRNIGGENALTQFAQRTGGRMFTPAEQASVDRAFGEIIRELRTQYLLGYYPKGVPPSTDPYHRLDIKLSRQDLRVLARSGYYEEASESRKGWRSVR